MFVCLFVFCTPEPDLKEIKMGIDELVDALNYFSSSSSWRKTDLESAHRLGFTRRQNRRRNYDHQESPRPLIVTFCHVDDKVLILPDRDLREHRAFNRPHSATTGATTTPQATGGEWFIIRTVSYTYRTVMPRPLKITASNAITIAEARRGVSVLSVTSPVSVTLIEW